MGRRSSKGKRWVREVCFIVFGDVRPGLEEESWGSPVYCYGMKCPETEGKC